MQAAWAGLIMHDMLRGRQLQGSCQACMSQSHDGVGHVDSVNFAGSNMPVSFVRRAWVLTLHAFEGIGDESNFMLLALICGNKASMQPNLVNQECRDAPGPWASSSSHD